MNIAYAMGSQGAAGQGGSQWMSFLPLILLFVVFYFLLIRPQQKRAKEREKLLSNIEKGDKIITSGGVHATIVGIEEKTVLIEIAPNVKIKIERSAIGSVVK